MVMNQPVSVRELGAKDLSVEESLAISELNYFMGAWIFGVK